MNEARIIYTVDSFADGVAVGAHRLAPETDAREHFHLRLNDEGAVPQLRSRYLLNRKAPLTQLENHMLRLSRQGNLREIYIYFGVTRDPFHPFEGGFDASMRFLDLFSRYTPARLVVQTRSPLIVLAVPVLKRLASHASVTIGLETPLEESVAKYTPGLPRIEERLRAVRTLRKLGIPVTLQAAPLLPYGDWVQDAPSFAELLAENADRIYIRPLADCSEPVEKKMRASHIARQLARQFRFHWLRPDSARHLISAVRKLAPEKLDPPAFERHGPKQLGIFAA